jgi:hypothetical protein
MDTGNGYTIVFANPDTRITGVTGTYLRMDARNWVGRRLEEVKLKYGAPRAIRSERAVKSFSYTTSRRGGSFYTRVVEFDGNGRVNGVVAGLYYD